MIGLHRVSSWSTSTRSPVEACLPDYPPFGKRMLVRQPAGSRCSCAGNVQPRHRPHPTTSSRSGIETAERRAPNPGPTSSSRPPASSFTDYGPPGSASWGATPPHWASAWSDDNPTAYLGITVPGFPNLFLMYGPNTNLAHGGSIFSSTPSARPDTSCRRSGNWSKPIPRDRGTGGAVP